MRKTDEKVSTEEQKLSLIGGFISSFSFGEPVYGLRHQQWGIIKSVDGKKGCVIAFSDDNNDYEYHYSNEVSKNGL